MKKITISLSEIKDIQLGILNVIDCFCKSKNLRYSLAAGSLLGAVRHQGYIPWDDDIDIMIPRPDYERFIREFNGYNANLVLQDANTDPSHYLPFAKVYDNRTELISSNSIGGVYVDIFPIDGLPDISNISNYYEKVVKLTKLLWYSMKPNYKYVDGNKLLLKGKIMVKALIFPSRNTVVRDWQRLFNTYPFDGSSNAGAIVSDYGLREHLPRAVFDNYVDMLFEGRYYKCIEAYDVYLRNLYGDYMQLPPVEERVSHHNNHVFWR